jgi:hypothetical protein
MKFAAEIDSNTKFHKTRFSLPEVDRGIYIQTHRNTAQ